MWTMARLVKKGEKEMSNRLTANARDLVLGLEGNTSDESICKCIIAGYLTDINGYIQIVK